MFSQMAPERLRPDRLTASKVRTPCATDALCHNYFSGKLDKSRGSPLLALPICNQRERETHQRALTTHLWPHWTASGIPCPHHPTPPHHGRSTLTVPCLPFPGQMPMNLDERVRSRPFLIGNDRNADNMTAILSILLTSDTDMAPFLPIMLLIMELIDSIPVFRMAANWDTHSFSVVPPPHRKPNMTTLPSSDMSAIISISMTMRAPNAISPDGGPSFDEIEFSIIRSPVPKIL